MLVGGDEVRVAPGARTLCLEGSIAHVEAASAPFRAGLLDSACCSPLMDFAQVTTLSSKTSPDISLPFLRQEP